MQFVGRVAAIGTVDLRARVTGFLERGSSSNPRALFIEGADVKEGDLLYLIEQPPFQAQVAAAKAQVAQAKPNLAEANATLQRVQEAVPSGAVSKQELDQATAAAEEGQAQVMAAKAQLQTAEIDLGYTEVYTLTVRARFANPRRILVDGQFVTVTVETAAPVTALVVPQPAVQTDRVGRYVLVVDNDDKVEQRRVTLGAEHGTDVVVQSGVKQGEKVIVEGIQKVRPGMVVAATAWTPPPMPGAAASAAPAAGQSQRAEAAASGGPRTGSGG
jgi:multidrug efflux pump subunit AcrA (membrane-fusion protein)